jgi:hypothetical protein
VRSRGGDLLDEAVLKVSRKGRPSVYDPRRTMAGALTPALTWGLFGLVATGGSLASLVLWALVGALCGGLYAYFTEHLLSGSQLKAIAAQMGPDTSALTMWAEAADAQQVLSAAAALHPTAASIAEIADDLSARVFAGTANPVEGASGSRRLSMLLLRYPGERSAREMIAQAAEADGDTPEVELVFESAKSGKRRVFSPAKGVAVMAKADVISWGGFGLVFGVIVSLAGNGGVLSSIEDGVVTGVLWAIAGLAAGALYGLWAGRGVSARRLKGVGPLLPPDTSVILAWADGDGAAPAIEKLATPTAERLDLRFSAVGQGAVLEV